MSAFQQTSSACVKCGKCIPGCTIYRISGDETRSPRGFIDLLGAYQRGQLALDKNAKDIFESCFLCTHCVSVCPSSLPTDELIESVRADIAKTFGIAWYKRAFFSLLAHRKTMNFVSSCGALFAPLLFRTRADGMRARLPLPFVKNRVLPSSAFIARDPERFGRLIVRPVDRRENYVKRCVGLPGEWLEIRNDTIFIDGSPIKDADHVQYNYIIPVSAVIPREKWQEIGVRMEDAGGAPIQLEFVPFPFYDVPLTAEARKTVESWPEVSGPLVREAEAGYFDMTGVFPQHDPYGWTRPNMSAFWIPKRGVTLRLTLNNLPLYRRCVEVYEGNRLEVSDGKILINGEDNPYYTFKYDYYWMEGDNRDRSLDSRYWGFVPEDHIVGSPMLVLTSFDQERSLFDGSLRWDRTFINPNPDKAKSAEKGW